MECYFRENEISKIRSYLESGDSNTRLLFVSGQSGVGKSRIIDEAIMRIGLEQKYARFSFRDNVAEFKGFLNDQLMSAYQELPWYQRLISQEYKIVKATLNVPPLSAAYVQKCKAGKSSFKLGLLKTSSIIFESSPFRLNGREAHEFFERLWKYLTRNGISLIWISNAECSSQDDLELIGLMAQSLPENIKLIIEAGTLTGTKGLALTKAVIEKAVRHNYENMEVWPFDENIARKFYDKVGEITSVDSFNYKVNSGLPLSIIYGISQSDETYGISKFMEQQFKKNTHNGTSLLFLSLFYNLIDSYQSLSAIALNCGIKFETNGLLEKQLIDISGDHVCLCHPVINEYIIATKGEALQGLLAQIIPTLWESHDVVAMYLRLHHSRLLNVPVDTSIANKYLSILIRAIDCYDMDSLSSLLPLKVFVFDKLSTKEKEKLLVIDAQYSIFKSSLGAGQQFYSASINVMLTNEVLQLQQLYHSNEFIKAVDYSDSILRKLGQSDQGYVARYFYSITTAIKGVSLIAIGSYPDARDAIAESKRYAIQGSKVQQYLLLLDSFSYGMDCLAEMSEAAGNEISNPYIRAKFFHNLFAARMYTQFKDESLWGDIKKHVITPLHKLRSREISYTLNNLAVLMMLNGRAAEARKSLMEAVDKTFEIYDQLTIFNNLIMACALTGKLDEAKEFQASGQKLLARTKFGDPAFVSKFYLNSATLFFLANEAHVGRKYLDLVRLPSDSDDFDDVMSKVQHLQAGGAISLSCNRDATRACHYNIFWPKIIHFWDFTIPFVDKKLLSSIGAVRKATIQ